MVIDKKKKKNRPSRVVYKKKRNTCFTTLTNLSTDNPTGEGLWQVCLQTMIRLFSFVLVMEGTNCSVR